MIRYETRIGNVKLYFTWGWRSTYVLCILLMIWHYAGLGIAALALASHFKFERY